MKKPNGPTTNRHNSAQDHATPLEFICAVEGRFDLIEIDLAATESNTKAGRWLTPEENSLEQDWAAALAGRFGYLNPEFDPILPWVDKCIEQAARGARFGMLSRAAIDSKWFWKMERHCTVYALKQRIKFIGSPDPYPSPLIFSSFNCVAEEGPTIEKGRNGLYLWDWKADSVSREGYQQ